MTTPDHHPNDLRAVAAAYRGERMKGLGHLEARGVALAVYRDRHPNADNDEAGRAVAELIFKASEELSAWLYVR